VTEEVPNYVLTLGKIKANSDKELIALYKQFGQRLFLRRTFNDEDGVWKVSTGPNIDILSAFLIKAYHVKTLQGNSSGPGELGEIYFYNWNTHVYERGKGDRIKTFMSDTFKGKHYREKFFKEALNRIRPASRLRRDKFKLDSNFLPMKNGMLKLNKETWEWELLPNDPKYYVTVRSKLDYIPDAECPKFI